MSKEAAKAAVTAFYEAEEALQDIIDEVRDECGDELWEQMLKSLHERKSACDMARKMVKEAGVGIDDFKIQMRSKNVWDSKKAIAIAKRLGELDDMIERGIIVQGFDPRAAKQMLDERGLARAVLAHEPKDLPAPDLDRDAAQRLFLSEAP